MTFTHDEMLSHFRLALGLNAARTDCSVEAFDGIDLDACLATAMRQWYLRLLDTAEPRFLPTATVGDSLERQQMGGGVLVALPADCRRVVAAMVDGWSGAVVPCSFEVGARRLMWSNSPYAKPGKIRPLAMMRPDGLYLAPATAADGLSLTIVQDPGAERYILDESLLATIPDSIFNFKTDRML